MRIQNYINIVAIIIIPVTSYYLLENDPIYKAFVHFENMAKDGCRIDVLPESIDWCDGKLNKGGKLPDLTLCQSIYKEDVKLLCRNGQWVSLKHGRFHRSIAEVYKNTTNTTCERFCVRKTSEQAGQSVPYFEFCPSSVTLYPVGNEYGNETNVQHTWDSPQAADTDGNITSLVQIVGPESNSTFEGTSSPGKGHVISYLATDNDKLLWTCSFHVTVEIPTCAPIVHIKNGISSCTNENSRYSTCSFFCNSGYVLNGTQSAECQENGTWSYGDEVPQCTSVVCEDPIVVNDTDVEIICDMNREDNDTDTTLQFGSVCWMQCPNDYLLKNDILLADTIQNLNDIVSSLIDLSGQALSESNKAQELADDLDELAAELEYNATVAENHTLSLEASVQTAVLELNEVKKTLQETEQSLANKQQEYETAMETSAENADDLLDEVIALNQTLVNLEGQIADLQLNLDTLSVNLAIALNASITARQAADQALVDAENAQVIADEKKAIQEQTAIDVSLAIANFNNQNAYSSLTNIIVSSYAICNASGQWAIPGEPYCLDIHSPEMKCIPVVTQFLNVGQTSGLVTWSEPEVSDNSGNVTIYKVSGPSPGSNLAVGQYIATYRAEDETGNMAPDCKMVINVNVYKCDDIVPFIENENVTAACESFELGSMCTLSCIDNLVFDGTANVTCKQNVSTLQMYWDFIDTPNCTEAELCAEPEPPTNGIVECLTGTTDFENDTAGNTTVDTGITCVFTCNESYMLPYKTDSVYKCSDEGVWESDDFPTQCVETGEEKNTEYTFRLKYQINNTCITEDMDSFVENWLDIMAQEMTSYTACMMGYMCAISESNAPECDDIEQTVTVEFTISVTCEGEATSFPLEASCDLLKNETSSLESSIINSVEVDGVLGSNVLLARRWLHAPHVVFPQCPPGAVLVGSYCSRCSEGYFYSTETDACASCPVGFYSNSTGSISCSKCPSGSSTLSKSSKECTEMCSPGSYSSSGLEPCACCRTGTYQSDWEQNTCIKCQTNTWTTGERSDSEQDCVDYDLYFDAFVTDINLIKIDTKASVVFWMKYYYATQLTFGIYNANDDPVFQLDVSESPQIIDGWDNEPLEVTMEKGTWKMFGFTWDASSGDTNVVSVYSDGELIKTIDLSQMDSADKLKMSANNGTFLSGLSISNETFTEDVMADMYADCGNSLTGASFFLDDLAVKRLPAMKYTASTCRASNASIEVDHCGTHQCQNNGACVTNDVGYTCNCTEQYGGPFCEEELVHGKWSEWFAAEGCSVSCGNGTQLMYRFCNNPTKSQYGDDCEGNSTEMFDCVNGKCPECEPPEVESVETCDIEDDTCEAKCPPGYVMPRGQDNQMFLCGMSTNYEWLPFNRLPICTESKRPQGYSVTMVFTFVNPVPCEKVETVIAIMTNLTKSQRCETENEACVSSVEIRNCVGTGNRRKRASDTELLIVLTIPILSNGSFDLAAYFATSVMSESLLEAVTSISVLEQTIQDILDDPGQYTAEVDGVTYTIIGNSVVVTTTTLCNSGEVAVGAVCAECQKGTHESNGFCVYCNGGTYQSMVGQSTCTVCPGDGTTNTIGARSASECISLPEEPKATDLTTIIIVVVVVVLGLIVVFLLTLIARRFYLGAKDREKYDMEADRISLYTDFPDIAYNVYFKRRQVLGFDEKGYPVIAKTKYQANGTVKRDKPEVETMEEGRTSQISNQELKGKEDEHVGPFDYDPYALWADGTFVNPYEYPQEDTFDFPKIEHAVRYRVPGRKHLQNSYPLSQFGYTESAHGRSRKNLPLPVNIPIPKKLPQLMYRKPDTMSLTDILKSKYGFRKMQNETEEGIPFPYVQKETPVPPLSLKKQPGKKIVTKGKGRKMSTASSAIQSTRSDDASSRARVKAPKTAKLFKASSVMISKLTNRSPRSTSAISPRSLPSTGTPSPRPATTMGRSPRSTDIDDDTPHPKPSRYVVPKGGPLPKNLPLPTKSALKVSIPDEPRPDTGMTTGRKSVTIREDANTTRRSTTTSNLLRPATAGAPQRTHPQPTTEAVSARETIAAPYAAKPKSNFMSTSDHPMPLPSDITEAYRPTSSFQRPITPAEHPRPVLHSGVTVKRSSEHAMFFPPTNISFEQQPPIAHTIRQMQPPPFLNKVKPDARVRRNSSLKRARFEMGDNSEESSMNGSFFLTELPEELSASRASLAGSLLSRTSKTSKKPSPPPDYHSSRQDTLIEISSMSNFEE